MKMFRVIREPGDKVNLKKWPTKVNPSINPRTSKRACWKSTLRS